MKKISRLIFLLLWRDNQQTAMRKIFFFLLLISLGVYSNAQTTTTKKRPDWGLRTGLNISKLRVDEGSSADPLWKTGFVLGAYFKIKAGNNFAIQPEFQYSSLGGNFDPKSQNPQYRLNYFAIPVLANINVCKNFSAIIGPEIDFLIQGKTRTGGSVVKSTGDFKDASFGLTGGFEYWPAKKIGFSGRYHHGLSRVTDDESGALRNVELQNQAVQLSIALRL
jgi:hypothetical protein